MINERILRDYSMSVYMNDMNKIINSKAVFNQRDFKTAVLIIQLLNNKKEKEPIDLTGSSVLAKILKNDDTKSVLQCDILDKIMGVVAISFSEQALTTIGLNSFELQIQSGSQILHSPKISYIVVDNLYDEDEAILSQDEFPVLNSLINNVQSIEKELLNLESMVEEGEETRNYNEEERKLNEIDRTSKFNEIKLNIETAITNINKKIDELNKFMQLNNELINNNINKINDVLSAKVKEFDDKILEINAKLEESGQSITAINKKIIEVEAAKNKIVKEFDNKTAEFNSKLDEKIADIDGAFNNKLNEVDLTLKNKLIDVNSSFNEKIVEVDLKVNNKISEVDLKAAQLENSVNNCILEVANKIDEADSKIANCEEKIETINNLNTQISAAEEIRNNKEIERNSTINTIVEELQITNSDIEDIVNMIGGL